jgi:hypothetical protein
LRRITAQIGGRLDGQARLGRVLAEGGRAFDRLYYGREEVSELEEPLPGYDIGEQPLAGEFRAEWAAAYHDASGDPPAGVTRWLQASKDTPADVSASRASSSRRYAASDWPRASARALSVATTSTGTSGTCTAVVLMHTAYRKNAFTTTY